MSQCGVAATSPEVLLDTKSVAVRAEIAGLTGLRGFAALVVVAIHGSSLSAYQWFGFHTFGPIALFVLSGFLLIQPWSRWILRLGSRPDLSTYAHRRFWRIFPAYLVVFAVITVIYEPARPSTPESWIRNLTLMNIYVHGDLGVGLYHTWSLAVELTWYALLPLLGLLAAHLLRQRRIPPITFLLAMTIAAAFTSIAWTWLIHYRITDIDLLFAMPHWFPSFAVCFLIGALLGHFTLPDSAGSTGLSSRIVAFAGRHTALVGLVGIGFGVIANSQLGGPWNFDTSPTFAESLIRFGGMTMMAVILTLAVFAAPPGSAVEMMFGNKAMVAVGRWSYSLYLWHLPVMMMLRDHMDVPPGPVGLALWILLISAIAMPLAAATFRFVERPSMEWSRRHLVPHVG